MTDADAAAAIHSHNLPAVGEPHKPVYGPDAIPAPGSDTARARGCTCAVHDNHHGRGIVLTCGRIGFWVSCGCIVHWPNEEEEALP